MAEASLGDKRKKQWKSGGNDQKRFKGAMASSTSAKGSSGILVTCARGKERQSVKEALNILNEVADKYFPKKSEEAASEETTKEGDQPSTVAEQLEAEIAALKEDTKKRVTGRFTPLDTGVKCVLLIQIKDPELSALALVTKIMEEVEETKEVASRFISRFIPLEKIGYASIEDLKKAAEELFESFLVDYKANDATKDTPIEFSVELKRRSCSALESMQIINEVAGVIGRDYKVNLTKPNVVVVIEICRMTFGMSIVTNFLQYRKFNVRSIIDPPVSVKPTEATTSSEPKDTNEQKESPKAE